MTCDQQMQLWRWGIPVHNLERDECCPDFSCCRPELLAAPETRLAFIEHPEQRDSMLMSFLGIAIATYKTNKKIHIAGQTTPNDTIQ